MQGEYAYRNGDSGKKTKDLLIFYAVALLDTIKMYR